MLFKNLQTKNSQQIKMLFYHVFPGSKGCINRVKIIFELQKMPLNINQLATKLGTDHKNIKRHIIVLENYELIIELGTKYGVVYFISSFFESNMKIFDEIIKKSKNCNEN